MRERHGNRPMADRSAPVRSAFRPLVAQGVLCAWFILRKKYIDEVKQLKKNRKIMACCGTFFSIILRL